ncbi:hypothetical protein CcaverHIS002_0205810 [Cutaneotrichosporon cavernicola]|nr:hypothetical protein CcaverHIS002_0205810 [Cutaneotrichosporon cavernicola]
MDPIATLGEDVFLLILEHLAPADVIQVDSVSHSWRDFVREHDVWHRICRRDGIDVREHRHAHAERVALWRGEDYAGELVGEASPADCRRAYLDHGRLAKDWEMRFGYETLVKAPGFKIRSIYMDHGEDFIYALTEMSMTSDEECLLVLNKYTGHLLQRIPGMTPSPNISVGAGYVAVSQHTRDSPRDRRREYSPLGTVTVFRTATAAVRTTTVWHNRGPLEFAFHLSDEGVRCSDVMAVKLVRGQGLLVTANKTDAHLIDLDLGKRSSISLEHLDTIESPFLDEGDLRGREPKVWSVNITDDHLFVVTQYQVHIFTHSGEKLATFPDPCADYLSSHAGLAYAVKPRYPYGVDSLRFPGEPKWRPPGFEFYEAVVHGFAYPADWDDYDWDESDYWYLQEGFQFEGMNAWLQDVSFTMNDLVIRGRQGAIFIVRDYCRVLRDVCDIEEAQERTAYIGQHTIVIGFHETNDVVACYGNRIALHAAHSVVFVLDTTQLPSMPWNGSEDMKVSATVFVFEDSSLEMIQDESSVVMDARGLYLADWDKGMPDATISYEDMNKMYRDYESWPFTIRPNWGCIKAWIFRPTAALLHRPYAKARAEAVKRYDWAVAHALTGEDVDDEEDESGDE